MRIAAVLSVVAALAVPGAAAGSAPRAQRLSDERTFTSWAHPLTGAAVRAAPDPGAPVVDHLHLLTEDDAPEVYLLLSSADSWVRLRLPGRPNGRTGWVPREALGAIHTTSWALRVNLRLLDATLFNRGRAVWSARVGVGAPATPTPTGHFWVRELLEVPGHTLYGPYAFGTSAYSSLSDWPHGGVVGIHGTDQPSLIPGHPSHGCVRLRNPDIVYLAHHLPVGAPVHVVG